MGKSSIREIVFSVLNNDHKSVKQILPPDDYHEQILTALKFFPELKDVNIIFKVSRAKFPLKSYPSFFSVFKFKRNRIYNIIISNSLEKGLEFLLLSNIPYEGQIGVLGHELSHIVDYEKMSSWELIVLGFKYFFFKGFRFSYEKSIDTITIQHDLGKELLCWRNYFESMISDHTLKSDFYFEDRYLTAIEIKQKIDDNTIL